LDDSSPSGHDPSISPGVREICNHLVDLTKAVEGLTRAVYRAGLNPWFVHFNRLDGFGQELLDLRQCRFFPVRDPFENDSEDFCAYYLSPDGRWIKHWQEDQPWDGRWGEGYREEHPVEVAHDLLQSQIKLPPELEPYRKDADLQGYPKWLRSHYPNFYSYVDEEDRDFPPKTDGPDTPDDFRTPDSGQGNTGDNRSKVPEIVAATNALGRSPRVRALIELLANKPGMQATLMEIGVELHHAQSEGERQRAKEAARQLYYSAMDQLELIGFPVFLVLKNNAVRMMPGRM
jgi:hypothetical protein